MNQYTIHQQFLGSYHLLIIKRFGQFVILSAIICLFSIAPQRAMAQTGESSPFNPPIRIGYDPDNKTTSSMAWGDVDNDGDLDLVVGTKEVNRLYLNERGMFQLRHDMAAGVGPYI